MTRTQVLRPPAVGDMVTLGGDPGNLWVSLCIPWKVIKITSSDIGDVYLLTPAVPHDSLPAPAQERLGEPGTDDYALVVQPDDLSRVTPMRWAYRPHDYHEG